MLPLKCAICNGLLKDHFDGEGGWNGCYPLDAPRAFILGEPRIPVGMLAGGMAMRQHTTEDDRSRLRYTLVRGSRKKSEEAMKRLRGQQKRVFIVLSSPDVEADGLTLGEISERAQMKRSSAEFAVWKLKKEGLAETRPI
jgi:hypothetical protein